MRPPDKPQPQVPIGFSALRESRINLLVGWRLVRKHWATALATAMAICLAVTFYTLGQTKIYLATSTVQLDPNPPRPLGKDMQSYDMGAGDRWSAREYCETQYKIIQSMRVALGVVRELDLNHDTGFIRMLPPARRLPRWPSNPTRPQRSSGTD